MFERLLNLGGVLTHSDPDSSFDAGMSHRGLAFSQSDLSLTNLD
jgi:hypothetical protein